MKIRNGWNSSFNGDIGRIVIVVMFLLIVSHFSLLTCFADDISARAAVVIDGSTGNILYAKNPNVKLFRRVQRSLSPPWLFLTGWTRNRGYGQPGGGQYAIRFPAS